MLRLVAKLASAAAITMAGESIAQDRYAAERNRMAAEIASGLKALVPWCRRMMPISKK